MEKLIELLNEYEIDKDFRDYEWRIERKTKERMCWTEIMWMSWEQFTWAYVDTDEMERIIISKRYWFIKWLVENDKIDFSLIPNKIKEIWIPMKINWEIKYWFDSSDYYWLLMLLSISDTPIEDLISYLK